MELVRIFKRLVCGHQGEREISPLWPSDPTCLLFSGMKTEAYNIPDRLSISLALVWGHITDEKGGVPPDFPGCTGYTLDFLTFLTSGLLF